ncbi:efflux RND transporter permease subunit [Nitrosophilus alvini]|uniref:efflux RND transporter permease subunit n=1 Tax=Nitrosophilus alvini TaxID=2714855 RepID=UPI00190D1B8A|nr:CusA/CzcA family heavy metal efflux RND transporter [Nitrosophilus alvini]
MIEKIIDLGIKGRFFVVLTFVLLSFVSLFLLKNLKLDALPDLSPTQVIVEVNYSGQSPSIIEDQVVYPIVTTFMGLPDVETVRALSGFENGLVYIIFKDGTDLYWARSRVLEKLSELATSLPKEAIVKLGPDATGIGWVYEYALVSKTKSLEELRSLQDYYIKYALLGVEGVSEVASLGGFVKSYEITIDHDKIREYGLTYKQIKDAVKKNNNSTGGGAVLENGFEQIIDADGYLKNTESIENIVLKNENGFALRIKDIASVNIAPMPRRGVADLNGKGEVVSGIVVMRQHANAYEVIDKIKAKLNSLQMDDVEIVEVYDRSSLIEKAIDTLKKTLTEESIIVLIIISAFLLHLRSALVIIITLPLTILLTLGLMAFLGIESNIMSLGGIAIAVGAMVDASIVMVENVHKHLAKNPDADQKSIIINAAKQVGRPVFFALILIVVSFLPIFALSGQEGKLFIPMAYTKTFAMTIGALLSILLVPLLMLWLIRGKIPGEEKNPLNRFFIWIYTPILKLFLLGRYIVIILFIASFFYLYYLYEHQKWEFMPPLNEESFMYMPVTPPGISIDLAKELTQKTDKILASFPEVKSVFGKAGRADTATDPAPLSMIETIIEFKPQTEWREGMTYEKLMNEMEETLQIPGLTNSWTYPIRGRIDMLLTGIRTPLGIKIYGNDIETLQKTAKKFEEKLSALDITSSVFAERNSSGYYIDIDIDEKALQKYSVDKDTILEIISYAVGGKKITTMIEGLERYPVKMRLDESFRNSAQALENILVPTPNGYQPLKTFAKIGYKTGPAAIKSEKGMKVSYVYITPKENISADEYKQIASKSLESIELPSGFFIEWAGQSEYLASAMQRLKLIIPATVVIILILIYFALGSVINSILVFMTLPFALLGGLWYVDFLDYNMSIAVIVGFLALLGVAAETAIVMIIYLEEARKKYPADIKKAVIEGAALRLRPKLMTVFALIAGLIPIMFAHGVGSEVMQRIAAPMIGGLVSSSVLTLLIVPVFYYMVFRDKKEGI